VSQITGTCEAKWGLKVVGEEGGVVCLSDEGDCEGEFFSGYEEIPIKELRLFVKGSEWKGERYNLYPTNR
jgi:hypothetical protein